MTTNHTPGPWKIVTGNSEREFNEASIRPEKTPIKGIVFPIASVRYPNHAFGLANAFLIAAAPDLLEACKALMLSFSAFQHEFQNIDESPEVIQCRNAIIKATGSTT
jgi:hypothetical protein